MAVAVADRPPAFQNAFDMRSMTAALAFVLAAAVAVPGRGENPSSWTEPVEPFRIAGNLWYVGTADLGSFLLIGRDGAILLDAPLEENAQRILRNVRKAGVKPSAVGILLNSHAHFDHAGGLATVKKATGAALYLSPADAELAERGGRSDFAFGDEYPFAPVRADHLLRDGEVVRLGDLEMTALFTPGHTKGCTSWRTTVVEKGKPLDVVFVCSLTAPGYKLVGNEKYPEIMDDYRRSIETLRAIGADIFLSNHGSFFDLTAKRARVGSKENPFIDREALGKHLDWAWSELQKKVAAERGEK